MYKQAYQASITTSIYTDYPSSWELKQKFNPIDLTLSHEAAAAIKLDVLTTNL